MSGRAVVKYADETPSRIPIPSSQKAPKRQRTLKELKEDIEKLKRSAAETERRFSEFAGRAESRKTKPITEPAGVQEHAGALDDDVDVWNLARRRASADLDFSVVGIDDDSDCEVHTVPCGDPLCDRCTVVFSEALEEYHDDRILSKLSPMNSKKPQSPVYLGIEPVVGNLIRDPEHHVYCTSPVQQIRVSSSKDALMSYLGSRRRDSKTGVDLSKFQSPVSKQGENTSSKTKAGRKESIRSPLSELKAKLKAATADQNDQLDSTYLRRALTITDDPRVDDHNSTSGEARLSHSSDGKIHRATLNLKKEAKMEERDIPVLVTPAKSSRPTPPVDTPKAPAKTRPSLSLEVEPPASPLSFKERLARASGQSKPNFESPYCAEPLGTPRIGKGSRPPLSRSSGFSQGGDYFPYNHF